MVNRAIYKGKKETKNPIQIPKTLIGYFQKSWPQSSLSERNHRFLFIEMVTVLKADGGTQTISVGVQKTIQSIKEIVKNHSDTEIYIALKESNMDPNEAAQKLLNQDPFHEVKRKRDKKMEDAGFRGSSWSRERTEHFDRPARFFAFDRSARNVRRADYARTDAGISREFRVVRDNRVNQNTDKETKLASVQGASTFDLQIADITEKSAMGASSNQRQSEQCHTSPLNGKNDSRPKLCGDINANGNGKEYFDDKQSAVQSSVSQVPAMKPKDSESPTAIVASSNSVVSVYASASDPVHVPYLDSRSTASIGAIKRAVGAVGVRRQSLEKNFKQSSRPGTSNSNSVLGISPAMDSCRPATIPKNDQLCHVTVSESRMHNPTASRPLLSNHHGSRSHQHSVIHQKGALPIKEWKPKTSLKSNGPNSGVIGTPVKSAPPPADNSKTSEIEASQLEDKLSQLNIHETKNVIIAQHIRVPENGRCLWTFGSFGVDSGTPGNSVYGSQAVGGAEESMEPSASNFPSSVKQVNLLNDQVRSSGSSTSSGAASEQDLPDKIVSTTSYNIENYSDMGLVHDNSPSFTDSESLQRQDPPELPTFSAYVPQTAYDIPYFSPSIDDAAGRHGLPSSQEALTSNMATSIPTSSMAMIQQQAPVAQMYPQVHVSHFANVMPYRQFFSPFYAPPVGLPGYSGDPGYPHPPNGNSYLLMPGANSHLTANGLKYGIQPFKPVPAGSPTGFGNFASPTEYAVNGPGVVGRATGVDDSFRLNTGTAIFTSLIHRPRHLKFGFKTRESCPGCRQPHTITCRGNHFILRPIMQQQQQLLWQHNLLTCSFRGCTTLSPLP
ncbi:hypothetical protein Nepgr_019421 [Nepenthes gracilis]|uniref:GBF-interacting protein 1 N-terminal domain-containing protein n=1 Tax=Nepenthes gracilis TaxID=150966 RepID=A0AAD3XV81_NEPGR|nr:hypothetical protein Nepgr_019421 [Nepenthes gracilis]